VFSRTSPSQKGIIVGLLNSLGHKTLMCGDGTNDVGSLKRADVGLAIVNNKEPSKEDKKKQKQMSPWVKKELLAGKTFAEQKEIQMKHMEEYKKQMQSMQGGDQAQLELGDACIAAPFTYKFSSLKSAKKIIRQGRSTLTTTFQMYKILSLNSLISAYTMSALYLDGVKMGDYQATFLGLGISVLFMMLSFAKPLKKLHKERPPTSIFHWSLVISVSVQFIAHLSVLLYFVQMCEPYLDRENDESLGTDAEFKPNLKNSIMFIYQWWLQTTVIFVNYSGRPFMESISENKKLYRMLVFMFGFATLITFNVNDEIRESLELVPFPNEEFQTTVIAALVIDLMICYGIEQLCRYFYLKQFDEIKPLGKRAVGQGVAAR
jgi:cation-transporting ATPase 13A1